MRILFLGQNPARSNPGLAFVGTRSGQTLLEWISKADLPSNVVNFANVYNVVTDNNRSLTASELKSAATSQTFLDKILNCDIVFVCGNQPLKAIHIAEDHFGIVTNKVLLPHPSGLNRKLNDKGFVDLTIKLISESYASVLLKKMERHKQECLPAHSIDG